MSVIGIFRQSFCKFLSSSVTLTVLRRGIKWYLKDSAQMNIGAS